MNFKPNEKSFSFEFAIHPLILEEIINNYGVSNDGTVQIKDFGKIDSHSIKSLKIMINLWKNQEGFE